MIFANFMNTKSISETFNKLRLRKKLPKWNILIQTSNQRSKQTTKQKTKTKTKLVWNKVPFETKTKILRKAISNKLANITGMQIMLYRNSHRRCSLKKDVFNDFAKFTGKHLCQSLSLNNVAGWGRCSSK